MSKTKDSIIKKLDEKYIDIQVEIGIEQNIAGHHYDQECEELFKERDALGLALYMNLKTIGQEHTMEGFTMTENIIKVDERLQNNVLMVYTHMAKEMLFHDCFTTEEHVQRLMIDLKDVHEGAENMVDEIAHILELIWAERLEIEYVLVKRVVGTESYITNSLERDIMDVWDWMIIPSWEVQLCDNVYGKSTNTDELHELMDSHQEEEYWMDSMIDSYYW